MSKKTIHISVDDEILREFDSEYKNRSKKIEELMEESTVEGSQIEELENKLEEYKSEIEYLKNKKEAVKNKLEKLKEGNKAEELVDDFVEAQVDKYVRGVPERWNGFDEFWGRFGKGILSKADRDGLDISDQDLEERIRKEADQEV